jgi:hypothetical protein
MNELITRDTVTSEYKGFCLSRLQVMLLYIHYRLSPLFYRTIMIQYKNKDETSANIGRSIVPESSLNLTVQ